jgi:hypothetical protein
VVLRVLPSRWSGPGSRSRRVASKPVNGPSLELTVNGEELFQLAPAASNPRPSASGATVGAALAATGLIRRAVGYAVIIVAALVAAIMAGVFWGVLSTMKADCWATVLDAALRPLIAVGTAWGLEHLKRPAAAEPETPNPN